MIRRLNMMAPGWEWRESYLQLSQEEEVTISR